MGSPPFNIVAILMVPYYLLVKDEDRLQKTNDTFTKVLFLPIALLVTLVFIAGNLMLVPFAYLVATVKKIKLVLKASRKKKATAPKVMSNGLDLAFFVILGIPMLLVSQIFDAFYFMT